MVRAIGSAMSMSVTTPEGSPVVTTESRHAVACGALGDRPLPRLLHQLFRKRVTGSSS